MLKELASPHYSQSVGRLMNLAVCEPDNVLERSILIFTDTG